MQKKIDELSHANDDMTNLLSSIDVGAMFVDAHLCIQRFTPAVTAVINVLPGDIGRPLTHLTANLVNYDRLAADAQQVFDTLTAKETAVQTADGHWYLMRILPYRTQFNAIAGVVITFVEITRQREMQEQIRQLQLTEQAHVYTESIVDTVREPLLLLDAELCVVTANRAFYDQFGVKADETVGVRIYELGNGQWNIPALRVLLEEILPGQTSFTDYQVQHTFENIGPRTMRLTARELRRINGEPRMILLAIEDVGERTGV